MNLSGGYGEKGVPGVMSTSLKSREERGKKQGEKADCLMRGVM